jgi:hypothetical protein
MGSIVRVVERMYRKRLNAGGDDGQLYWNDGDLELKDAVR